jgi:hypothetical protein
LLAREACDFELLDVHATPADQPDDGFMMAINRVDGWYFINHLEQELLYISTKK